MLLNLVRTPNGLVPIDDESVEAIKKIKIGYDIFVEFKPRRNMKFHKKYFALLNAVLVNQRYYKTVDNLHEAIKYKAGYYETIIPLRGESFLKTNSISFSSMDNLEFERFYNLAIDECIALVGDDAVNNILRFL
jgi:hypothetical protein